MNISEIITHLDHEIASLQQARAALTRGTATASTPAQAPKRGRGRPKSTASATAEKKTPGKKRTMSAEGRKRIAEAQRKRWAAVKSTA